jgi:protein kinase C-binding protein NELL
LFRFLELQSSGRKDEIRLLYTHLGAPRLETFSFRLADGLWHRIAVSVSGGVASLYVDCRRVERRWMSAAPDTSISSEGGSKMSVWIGQRGEQHFLFKVLTFRPFRPPPHCCCAPCSFIRPPEVTMNETVAARRVVALTTEFFCLQGAMQDVKLVAGSNGHLAQCPSAEPDCPTCGQFQTLQSVVARLEKSLQQLTDKVMISFAFFLIRHHPATDFLFVFFRRLPTASNLWTTVAPLLFGRISFAMQQSVIVTDTFTGRLC